MRFQSVRCEMCGLYSFEAGDVIAYRVVVGEGIEEVDLDGEQPWADIRCICRHCCKFVRDHPGGRTQDEAGESKHEPEIAPNLFEMSPDEMAG